MCQWSCIHFQSGTNGSPFSRGLLFDQSSQESGPLTRRRSRGPLRCLRRAFSQMRGGANLPGFLARTARGETALLRRSKSRVLQCYEWKKRCPLPGQVSFNWTVTAQSNGSIWLTKWNRIVYIVVASWVFFSEDGYKQETSWDPWTLISCWGVPGVLLSRRLELWLWRKKHVLPKLHHGTDIGLEGMRQHLPVWARGMFAICVALFSFFFRFGGAGIVWPWHVCFGLKN